MKMTEIVFVLGSHRTGTKSVANFLNDSFDQVTSIHQYGLLRFNNILANMTIAGYLPEKIFSIYLKLFWFPVLKRQKAPLYVESNGFNHYAALFAYRYFRHVKILHVVRHPADFVTSYTNWRLSRGKSQFANRIPFWHLNPDHLGYMKRSEFNRLDEVQKNIWRWRVKNEFLEKYYRPAGQNYLQVRFEDIIDITQRKATLVKMLQFLNLEYHEDLSKYFDQKQNESRKGLFPAYREWPDKYKRYLTEVCGGLMGKYGYNGINLK